MRIAADFVCGLAQSSWLLCALFYAPFEAAVSGTIHRIAR
jgi:hypothetical protein